MSKKAPLLTLNSIIFKKYLIISKIDQGSFGSIYLSKNIITNENVAIKVENRKISNPLLEREAYILFYLKGPGLPEIKSFGKTKDLYILIQTLLGPSLSNLLDKHSIKFTVKDICLLSIQMLERLEHVHSKNFIHRDIKPQNFLMGIKDPQMLYLIDFGLAKKYRSKKGKHIKYSICNSITGTPRYCSISAIKGVEQSRRDDLESLFYVIMYFFRGNLPWQNLKIKSREARFNKINEIKKNISYKQLCQNLPKELYELGIYIKNLKFEEDPDYFFMKKCFYSILENINTQNDNMFSWLDKTGNNPGIKKDLNVSSHISIFRPKNCSHKRLYEKIASSLEKKRRGKSESNIINNNKTQTQNATNDDITEKSCYIENNIENVANIGMINRSNSYMGKILIKHPNLNKNNSSLINRIINKNIISKNINNNRNDNINSIRKNRTQFYSNTNFKSTLYFGEENNNLSDICKYNSNYSSSLKNIFLRNTNITYNSPDLVANLKEKEKKEKLNKNIKTFVIKKENKDKIINRNDRLKEINYSNCIYSNDNINNSSRLRNKFFKMNKINNNKIINLNEYPNNNILYKRKIYLKENNKYIDDMNINNNNKNHIKSFSKINTEENQIKNHAIKKTNTYTFLKTDNFNQSDKYNISNNKLNIKYNPINLNHIDYFKNRNINLNIKLINNNNYNNILLKNTKEIKKPKNKKVNNIDITANINLIKNRNYLNRIMKYKTFRQNSTSATNLNINKVNYGIEENMENGIKILNIPINKNKLAKKYIFTSYNHFKNN